VSAPSSSQRRSSGGARSSLAPTRSTKPNVVRLSSGGTPVRISATPEVHEDEDPFQAQYEREHLERRAIKLASEGRRSSGGALPTPFP
jgi:hypothetical protein